MVDFGFPLGSAPGYVRPALVVSSDSLNLSRLGTAVVCPLTSTMSHADYPETVEAEKGVARLPKDSVILCHQVTTVSRRAFLNPVGQLPVGHMSRVERALRRVVGP